MTEWAAPVLRGIGNFRLAGVHAKFAVTGFIAFEHAAQRQPKALGRVRAENDAVIELDADALVARQIPGLVGAEEQIHLFLRALDVHHIGEMGGHLGVVPIDGRQHIGIRIGGQLLVGFRSFDRHDVPQLKITQSQQHFDFSGIQRRV